MRYSVGMLRNECRDPNIRNHGAMRRVGHGWHQRSRKDSWRGSWGRAVAELLRTGPQAGKDHRPAKGRRDGSHRTIGMRGLGYTYKMGSRAMVKPAFKPILMRWR